jgi:hypothetical protein
MAFVEYVEPWYTQKKRCFADQHRCDLLAGKLQTDKMLVQPPGLYHTPWVRWGHVSHTLVIRQSYVNVTLPLS